MAKEWKDWGTVQGYFYGTFPATVPGHTIDLRLKPDEIVELFKLHGVKNKLEKNGPGLKPTRLFDMDHVKALHKVALINSERRLHEAGRKMLIEAGIDPDAKATDPQNDAVACGDVSDAAEEWQDA